MKRSQDQQYDDSEHGDHADADADATTQRQHASPSRSGRTPQAVGDSPDAHVGHADHASRAGHADEAGHRGRPGQPPRDTPPPAPTHPHPPTRHDASPHGQDGHDHGHDHGHGSADSDWDRIAPFLEGEAEALRPIYEQAAARVAELRPVAGIRRILDIGSGPGVVTCLLAEMFPAAEVVAVDSAPALLQRTRERAERLGLAGRVRVVQAEMPRQIGQLGQADLIWMGNSLHHIGDQGAAMKALSGLLRPEGALLLVEGGLPSRHLPRDFGIGVPGLEARMEIAKEGGFADMRAGLPDTKAEVEDWATLFVAAGLVPAGTRSYLADHPAPLGPAVRDLVIAGFARHRGPLASRLCPQDLATLDRLLDPTDPQGLANRPDVFLLAAKSVHIGLAKS
ncbi:class I SAM-dependent methyltransferase [Streptomyces sp. NPDC048416]|uniref:class I SAM-dependent methyltransferase n=1 Tax=Streptomyces sp. NPDC048416 TaxID=3365546 RepID=UPI00371665DB